MMRHSEIHKFCDATLNRVLEGLKSYNNDIKYEYVQKDLTKEEAEYLKLFKEEIEERLKHIMEMKPDIENMTLNEYLVYEVLLRPTPLPEYSTRDFTMSTSSLHAEKTVYTSLTLFSDTKLNVEMVVKEIKDILLEEMEKFGWWFEHDIGGESEDDNEKKLVMVNEEGWMS
ncbi:hypothetical protein Tco_0064427 [Tanacetum coccineum]